MKGLEKQVTSLEIAIELREAGYKQEGLHKWYLIKPTSVSKNKFWILGEQHPALYIIEDEVVTPTVAELGERLKGYTSFPYWVRGYWKYLNENANLPNDACIAIKENTEANARAKLWLYLRKEKLI